MKHPSKLILVPITFNGFRFDGSLYDISLKNYDSLSLDFNIPSTIDITKQLGSITITKSRDWSNDEYSFNSASYWIFIIKRVRWVCMPIG